MEWRVVKTGAQLFDLLHAYGLGLLLAHGCALPVEVSDTGCTYSLTCGAAAAAVGSSAMLDEVLTLPTPGEVEAARLPEEGSPLRCGELARAPPAGLHPESACHAGTGSCHRHTA